MDVELGEDRVIRRKHSEQRVAMLSTRDGQLFISGLLTDPPCTRRVADEMEALDVASKWQHEWLEAERRACERQPLFGGSDKTMGPVCFSTVMRTGSSYATGSNQEQVNMKSPSKPEVQTPQIEHAAMMLEEIRDSLKGNCDSCQQKIQSLTAKHDLLKKRLGAVDQAIGALAETQEAVAPVDGK